MKASDRSRELPQKKELRSFGLMMGSVLALFTVVFYYKALYMVVAVIGTASLLFFVMGMTVPGLLRGIYECWMKFAHVLGNFNMKVILSFIYLTAFSAMRFLLLIMRKDPMRRKLDPKADSYWVDHFEPEDDPRRIEKQY